MQKTMDLSLDNATLRAKLVEISDALLSIAGQELQFMSCELAVIAEHPSVEEYGTVAGGLAALSGRMGSLMERLAMVAAEARRASEMSSANGSPVG